MLQSVLCCSCNVQFVAVKVTEGVAGVRPAAVSLELRSDSGVISHWKDYDQLAAFSFLSHQTAAPFHRTSTDTIPVPMVPQVGKFRTGRVHQLNAHAVELPLQVIGCYMEPYLYVHVHMNRSAAFFWVRSNDMQKGEWVSCVPGFSYSQQSPLYCP